MYDVVVYLSSLPRIADRDRKVQLLKAFAEGSKFAGAKTFVQTNYQVVPARLGVILGWYGQTFSGPHIHLRKSVIDWSRANGQNCMPIDGSCFKFADPNSMYVRYSLDGVFYNEHEYANKNSINTKWNQLRHDLKMRGIRPWTEPGTGQHILICLQRDGGWNMKGANFDEWLAHTVREIRRQTDKPILIRPHPKRKYNLKKYLKQDNIFESVKGSTLEQDIEGAYACVFYNSSSSVASILKGVPAFVQDQDAVTWDVANHDIRNILNPARPERKQWLYDLASCHWSDEEVRQGLVWKHFEPYLKS